LLFFVVLNPARVIVYTNQAEIWHENIQQFRGGGAVGRHAGVAAAWWFLVSSYYYYHYYYYYYYLPFFYVFW